MSELPAPLSERHRRIRRLKALLRPLPRRANVHRYPVIKFFAGAARRRPHLWSFKVGAMTPAFYAGSIIAFLPIYGFQFLVAFAAAVALRANLPTTVGLQLLTNPLTLPVAYGATYFVGAFIVGFFDTRLPDSVIGRTAYALVIGGLVVGVVVGFVLDMIYRFLAFEAKKHDWQLPRRRPRPPGPGDAPENPS